jgi:hypothetical protein
VSDGLDGLLNYAACLTILTTKKTSINSLLPLKTTSNTSVTLLFVTKSRLLEHRVRLTSLLKPMSLHNLTVKLTLTTLNT